MTNKIDKKYVKDKKIYLFNKKY